MRALLAALLLYWSYLPCAEAQLARPKTLAFVVGIERYEDAELDKLTFAADDAQAIHDQLAIVADLDPASVLLLADDDKKTSVTAAQLREELEKFVPKITNDSNVLVYFGGHGTLSPAGDLWFLPSNFSPTAQTNRVPFNEIYKYFHDHVRWRNLQNVKITFLVNMCGAGNATAADDPNLRMMNVEYDPETVRAIQRAIKELKLGVTNFAMLPATPRNRNTFEDVSKKRSVYAYHLLEGLRGAAAKDGVVTTGSLFEYLVTKLGDVEKPSPFDPTIKIGVTQQLEGESSFHLASALLAGARSLRSIKPRGAASESQEFSAQARLLEDLALMEFERVPSRNSDLAGRSALRQGALEVERYGAIPASLAEKLRTATHLTSEEQDLAKRLAATENAHGRFPDPHSFLEHLRAYPGYVALITEGAGAGDAARNTWLALLREFSPSSQFYVARSGGPGNSIPESLFTAVQEWRKENDGRPADQKRFMLVAYSGSAGLAPKEPSRGPIARECNAAEGRDDCMLIPFGAEFVQRLADAWGGPLAIIYDAPFGGYLIKDPPRTAQPSMLLVSTRQTNGRTYSGFDGCSTSRIMVQMLRDAPQDLDQFSPPAGCLERWKSIAAAPLSLDMAKPAWISNWNDRHEVFHGSSHLRPMMRYVLQVASGCAAQAFPVCAKAINDNGFGSVDPFERLVEAAELDLAGLYEQAAHMYDKIALQLALNSPAPPSKPLGWEAAWRVLDEFRNTVTVRSSGTRSKIKRKVVVLPVAVEDYSAPLVARVAHAIRDVEAYASSIESHLIRRKAEARVEPVASPRTAAEFLKLLSDTAKRLDSSAGDLLILAFSGRGVERDGRRYLALADAQPVQGSAAAVSPASRARTSGVRWMSDSLVDLWEIAEKMEGHWFFAIYDVQFSQPTFDANRPDQLLDKNLDSVRPIMPSQSSSSGVRQSGRPAISIMRREAVPRNQVHLWIDGRLTQGAVAGHRCSRLGSRFPAGSPLAIAASGVFERTAQGTFRDFANELADDGCLHSADEPRTIVLQGEVDVPLLGSGQGAEYVDFFHEGLLLADVNLRVAQKVASEVGERFPSARNRVALAAISVALSQLHSSDSSLDFSADRGKWLVTARQILELLTPSEKTELGEPVMAASLELLSRVFSLQGELQQATFVLKEANPPAVLLHRDLARRLARLTARLVRQQPIDALKAATQRLGQLPPDATPVAAGKRELDALLREERMNRSEPYRITNPSVVP